MISPEQCAKAYRQACEVELLAFKPGNVSIYSEGHDMTVEDFRVSADVSAWAISNPEYSLGEKIYYAVKATREAVACNTNLGIILLCAPLIQAAMLRAETQTLRESLRFVLDSTSIADAGWVYKAIRLASPGGLGESDQQDVNRDAGVNLREAMGIAAGKDRIALQYTHNFKDIFDFAILEYNRAFVLSGDCGWAALAVFVKCWLGIPIVILSESMESSIRSGSRLKCHCFAMPLKLLTSLKMFCPCFTGWMKPSRLKTLIRVPQLT